MVTRARGEAGPVGVVLAGGASRRLGEDKALLAVGGVSLAARAAEKLREVCKEVVVADGGRGVVPELHSVADGVGRGPAAGVLGAAAAFPGRPLLVLACDLPAVPPALLAELLVSGKGDWVVPRWQGRIEPLCALYGAPALAALGRRAQAGSFALHLLLEEPGLTVELVEEILLASFGEPEEIFFNLNTPADLARWRRA
ncbi:MAG TPA: molybdenum cofactor guanylyltransferase [Thermoanaerobaculia bacterium]|nr:molybdenum cofactor guanylyltransferase [Thermoanaerobaculia bacterium]